MITHESKYGMLCGCPQKDISDLKTKGSPHDFAQYKYHIYGAMEEFGDKWYLHSVKHFEQLEEKLKWYNLMWRYVTYTTTKGDLHEGK